jgi:hypothetical protein
VREGRRGRDRIGMEDILGFLVPLILVFAFLGGFRVELVGGEGYGEVYF